MALATAGWLVAGCVDGDFADGVFLCDPAAGADGCPSGMACATDGRCRRGGTVAASSSGGGTATSSTTGSGGATTTTSSAGGATSSSTSGAGGAGGGSGGTGGCMPKSCAMDYAGVCGVQDDGCGSTVDCGCTACSGSQTRAPLLVANDSTLGTINWGNEALAALEDGQYAVASTIPANGGETRRLYAYRYQFTIPSAATIDSIALRLVRRQAGGGTIEDLAIRLMTASQNPVASDKSVAGAWPDAAFMDANYSWGMSGLSVAQVNSNDFGAAVRVTNTAGATGTARVDFMELTVAYSCP
jgi:hypothetical protein